jgi:hypothetical protein
MGCCSSMQNQVLISHLVKSTLLFFGKGIYYAQRIEDRWKFSCSKQNFPAECPVGFLGNFQCCLKYRKLHKKFIQAMAPYFLWEFVHIVQLYSLPAYKNPHKKIFPIYDILWAHLLCSHGHPFS